VTYVSQGSTGYYRDLYALPAHSGSGVINKVTVHIRCKLGAGPSLNTGKASLRTNGVTHDSEVLTGVSTWAPYSWEHVVNPETTDPWTWDEIDALEIGVSLFGHIDTAYCTQVYVEVDYTPGPFNYERSLSTAIGLSASLSPAKTLARSLTTAIGLQASLDREAMGRGGWLCIASRDGGSTKTKDDGLNWSVCAQTALLGALQGSYFAQYLNRLCVLNYEKAGFSYSEPHDIVADWTNKPDYPNFMQRFTELFVSRDASDDPVLNFLTHTGMYYLDVFTN
ncbi:unnamed protein product, partial [marine sediment metagenome]